MTTTRGATFIRNAGQPSESLVTQSSVPFPEFRIEESGGILGLVRNFRQLVEAVKAATVTSRSLPFGGPFTYVVGYSFSASTPVQIAHRLGTKNVRAWLGHKSGPGDVSVGAVDDTYITLVPSAFTFTADVLLLVTP